jgi:hypothetical protein
MTPLQQFAVLHRAIDKLDLGSLADSPVAPAGTVVCFEDRTFEARFTELSFGVKFFWSATQMSLMINICSFGKPTSERARRFSALCCMCPIRIERVAVSAETAILPVATLLYEHRANLRRTTPANPKRPLPSNTRLPGSGV